MATLEDLLKRVQTSPLADMYRPTRDAMRSIGAPKGGALDMILSPGALYRGVTGLTGESPSTMKPDRRAARTAAMDPLSTGTIDRSAQRPPGSLDNPLGRPTGPLAGLTPQGSPVQQSPLLQAAGFTGGGVVGNAVRNQPTQVAPNPVLETSPGMYRNTNPGAEYGSAIFSDSAAGARGFNQRGNYAMALTPEGQPSFGPFGRTADEQTAIENRVAEIQRATDMIRSMRGVPTERERLQRRARQQISLDQGLGAFLNQAGDRNFARSELEALDARESSAAENQVDSLQAYVKAMQEQRGLDIRQQEANQGRYASEVDPTTGEMRVLDRLRGAFVEPQQGPLSLVDAQAKVDEEVTALTKGKGMFESMDWGTYGSEEQFRAKRLAELMGQSPSQGYTQEELAAVAQRPEIQAEARRRNMDPVELARQAIEDHLQQQQAGSMSGA